MAHPVPSPEAAMLFVPFGCTHPPPPPFLLMQNLSPKMLCEVTSQTQNLLTSTEVISGQRINNQCLCTEQKPHIRECLEVQALNTGH